MKPHHLFVDITAHGFGHLAQVAPVLNALTRILPALRLTIRSGLASDRLRSRIDCAFAHIEARSDFGFVMHDAVRIDHAATLAAYREAHRDWPQRVEGEAAFLRDLAPDLVLSDVAYLPLAGAAQAGIPSLAMSSLNWADLYAHFFAGEPGAAAIHRQMHDAYACADLFLRLTPAMPMASFARTQAIAPVAALGRDRRSELCEKISCPAGSRIVLVAFGGVSKELRLERWPEVANLRWLVPAEAAIPRADVTAFEPLALPFADLVRSVDAVLTKPGYGTFTEAACNGTAVLFVRRDDWPEQDCLIAWLQGNARCGEIDAADLAAGRATAALERLWRGAQPPLPAASGAQDAAALIARRITAGS